MSLFDVYGLQSQIDQLKKRCCCSSFGVTTGVPTGAPTGNATTVRIDPDTGVIYAWTGTAWESRTRYKAGVTFNGGGAELIPGYGERGNILYESTITGYNIAEHTEVPISGDIEITVSISPFVDYDTTPVFTPILMAELNSQVKNEVTGLNINIPAGSIIQYEIASASTVEIVHLTLMLSRA